MTGVFFQTFIKQFNNHVNKRRVLLLLDNAPSHIWIDVQKVAYPNLEVIFLSSNTTSKLQSMDASIISAFKRHYRKRQLQHAIDMIEDGKSPYKIDQLTAMYWSSGVWRIMNASILANCWNHTTLLMIDDAMPDENDNTIGQIAVEQDDFDAEFTALLRHLNLQDPMSLHDYLHIPEEYQSHEILSDEELIETAQTTEEDEEQEKALEKSSLGSILSEQDSIIGLGKAIAILEMYDAVHGEWSADTEGLISGLRKKQHAIRTKIVLDRENRMTQMSITSFFS